MKPSTEFYWAKGQRDYQCKVCKRERNARSLAADPARRARRRERERPQQRRRRYGVTQEQYDAMVKRQEGRCAGCLQEKPLQLDHCHATGVVRGLLCGQCNKLLGLAGDDTAVLRRLVRYLESSRCTDVNAAWCPIHGDCTCETRGPAVACPLHDHFSMHGESQFHDGLSSPWQGERLNTDGSADARLSA
jgi:hypothetical protein